MHGQAGNMLTKKLGVIGWTNLLLSNAGSRPLGERLQYLPVIVCELILGSRGKPSFRDELFWPMKIEGRVICWVLVKTNNHLHDSCWN